MADMISEHVLELVITALTSCIAGMAMYVARLQSSHAKEITALNERYQEAIATVQEARVDEMRSVTEAALTLKDASDGLQKAIAQLDYLERQRGLRPR